MQDAEEVVVVAGEDDQLMVGNCGVFQPYKKAVLGYRWRD
jgi:hypothetical protein